jgi:hypothetical protein
MWIELRRRAAYKLLFVVNDKHKRPETNTNRAALTGDTIHMVFSLQCASSRVYHLARQLHKEKRADSDRMWGIALLAAWDALFSVIV